LRKLLELTASNNNRTKHTDVAGLLHDREFACVTENIVRERLKVPTSFPNIFACIYKHKSKYAGINNNILVENNLYSQLIIIIIIIIYLLTAIGLSPGGSTHLHTNNTQNNTNNKRTIQITNNVEDCGPCPVLARFYPGICLTTEGKSRKNNSQCKRNFSQVNKNLSQNTVYILPRNPHITLNTSNLESDLFQKIILILDEICLIGNPSCFD
jgi:hypothetical protein